MGNLMTGTLSAIIKERCDNFLKKNPSWGEKYKGDEKSIQKCAMMIYSALEELARKSMQGKGGVAACGDDALLASAAIHFFDEGGEVKKEEIMEILKGGTEFLSNKNSDESKPVSTAKPSAKPAPKPAPKSVPKMGIVKPKAKPLPKPVEKEQEDEEDFDIF